MVEYLFFMPHAHLLALVSVFSFNACRPALPTTEAIKQNWSLLDGDVKSAWVQSGIPSEGQISVDDSVLSLSKGQPMTGARYLNWDKAGLPGTEYFISYEAMRVDGHDIFGMCTFPVSSHAAHATFVIGGWGGSVTGLSSIDFLDASENQTRAEMAFTNGRWYHIRIEVRPDDLRVWIDGKPMVNASIKGRKVSLRHGDIDHCLPFGFTTWNTTGAVRNVAIGRL